MADRYEKTDNDTVIDSKTGLEWQAEAAGPMPWKDAVEYAKALDVGGHTDWRLPSVQELVGLIDYGSRPATSFPGIRQGWYWSSSPFDSVNAWRVGFGDGLVDNVYMSYDGNVRCVRPGPSLRSFGDSERIAELEAEVEAVREDERSRHDHNYDLYEKMKARAEKAEAEVERLTERLHEAHQAFNGNDPDNWTNGMEMLCDLLGIQVIEPDVTPCAVADMVGENRSFKLATKED